MRALLLIPFLFTNYISFFFAGQGSLFISVFLVGLCGRKLILRPNIKNYVLEHYKNITSNKKLEVLIKMSVYTSYKKTSAAYMYTTEIQFAYAK